MRCNPYLKWLAGFALLAFGCAAAASAHELVSLKAGDATLQAALYKPAGTGPFPAIVALHGCAGIGRDVTRPSRRHADWGERLAAQGFAVLMPDSFGSRGLGSQCSVRERSVTPGGLRSADAIAARAWLAAQSFTRAGAINLLGWSNGGSTVLQLLRRADAGGFARAAAFYPGCRVVLERGGWQPVIPTLILIGEADDWTPAAPCKALAQSAGAIVTYIAYEGAYHGFDDPNSLIRKRDGVAYSGNGSGTVTQGTDPRARAHSLSLVPAFFGK